MENNFSWISQAVIVVQNIHIGYNMSRMQVETRVMDSKRNKILLEGFAGDTSMYVAGSVPYIDLVFPYRIEVSRVGKDACMGSIVVNRSVENGESLPVVHSEQILSYEDHFTYPNAVRDGFNKIYERNLGLTDIEQNHPRETLIPGIHEVFDHVISDSNGGVFLRFPITEVMSPHREIPDTHSTSGELDFSLFKRRSYSNTLGGYIMRTNSDHDVWVGVKSSHGGYTIDYCELDGYTLKGSGITLYSSDPDELLIEHSIDIDSASGSLDTTIDSSGGIQFERLRPTLGRDDLIWEYNVLPGMNESDWILTTLGPDKRMEAYGQISALSKHFDMELGSDGGFGKLLGQQHDGKVIIDQREIFEPNKQGGIVLKTGEDERLSLVPNEAGYSLSWYKGEQQFGWHAYQNKMNIGVFAGGLTYDLLPGLATVRNDELEHMFSMRVVR